HVLYFPHSVVAGLPTVATRCGRSPDRATCPTEGLPSNALPLLPTLPSWQQNANAPTPPAARTYCQTIRTSLPQKSKKGSAALFWALSRPPVVAGLPPPVVAGLSPPVVAGLPTVPLARPKVS